MILSLYIARRFAVTFAAVFVIFALLYGLLDMIEIIRRFSPANIGFVEILALTALRIPEGLYQILPLIVILSTLALFLGLARSNELLITRAAGRSALRTLVSPIIVALLIGVMAVSVMNPIVAGTTKQFEALTDKYLRGSTSVLSVSREGLWLRQGSEDGQTVIRARRASLDGTVLTTVTFIGFGDEGLPVYRIEARRAKLEDGKWVVTNAKEWRFDEAGIAEQTAQTHKRLEIPSDLTIEEIRDGFGTPSSIPIWDLPAFIERLEFAGFSARRHRVWFQTELAQPLFLASMVMIAAGFTMRHTRFGRTGMMVLMAILLGFSIYFIRNFAQILGENGQLPVMLAAWVPPIAAILLSLGLLLHLEDG